MAGWVTLLGFGDATNAAALLALLSAVPGPALRCFTAGGLVAVAQVEGTRARFGRDGRTAMLRKLQTVQMRLEAACRVGDFLPADPAHARCATGDVEILLAQSAPALKAALSGPGTLRQWDLTLRWPAEKVIAARREEIAAAAAGGGRAALAQAVAGALVHERARRDAALRQGVAGVAQAMAASGAGDTETGLTVLVAANGEAALEAALQALPDDIAADAEIDMRGPLPPLSFAAVRIDRAAAKDVAQAWRRLELPEQVNATVLQRHWRDTAFRLHPDRGAPDGSMVAQAGAAFRLLRDLLPEPSGDQGGEQAWSLPALQRHAACRMRLAAPALDAAP
jgi:hypothetical protein